MPALTSVYKLFGSNPTAKRPQVVLSSLNNLKRNYADTHHSETSSKQVVVQGNENEERVRVRRARPADVPRVLRFVREHARAVPGLVLPPSASHVILCDYVARALAQGHSMLAEQSETRRGWAAVRGLALGAAVCPWDAAALERLARGVRCARSRRALHLTAHCLRAPALHDKYRVHNILQVILIVPPDSPKNAEIVHILAKNAIQRGRDVGFPVIRFDVTDEIAAKSLEELHLKKEWQISFNDTALKETEVEPKKQTAAEITIVADGSKKEAPVEAKAEKEPLNKDKIVDGNFVAVYTAMTEPKNSAKI